MNVLEKIWNKVRPKTNQEIIEDYLAQSQNRYQLERRMKLLELGQSPIQRIIW